MRFKKERHSPIDRLIEFRETVFEEALEQKSVSQETLNTFRELARIACQTNPLARELPDWSMALMNGKGSIDSFEIAINEEF